MLELSNITQEDLLSIATVTIAAFLLALAITPIYTTIAFRKQWWKRPRTDSTTGEKAKEFNRLHGEKHKRHIPTMAGLIMVVATVIVTLVFNYSRAQSLLPLVAMVGAGLVGLLDDVINLKGSKGVAGLRTQLKFGLILAVALLGGWYFAYKLDYTSIAIPFTSASLALGSLGIMALFTLVVISTANAVNITDGLDGLAGGLLTSAFTAYSFIALLQGHVGIAGFCATIVGVLLAYTWFNIYPARFFMGDVGSFALGASLGVVAMLTDTVFVLPIIAGVFVIETTSSFLQIFSKRVWGKKLFRVAPIHHHFESIGWPETKVTMRFWILGQVAAFVGVAVAMVGGLL